MRGLVVTGNADSAAALRRFLDRLPDAAVTLCRLRAERDDLRGRYVERGLFPGALDRALEDAEAMDTAHFAELSVDTSGMDIVAAATSVLTRTGWSPAGEGWAIEETDPDVEPQDVRAEPPTPLLWLCGPRCVGKKAAGFTIAATLWRAGINAAFVDLAQLGYHGPSGNADAHELTAANLGAVWRGFREAGAPCVVVSGELDEPGLLPLYAAALPGSRLTLCRLVAGAEQLTERVLGSARSQGPGIPNPLKGRSDAELRSIARQAYETQQRLERTGAADGLRIDTSGLTVPEVAGAVTAQVGGWPRP
ncbi:hypothetical protein [Flindersiella endophytica]